MIMLNFLCSQIPNAAQPDSHPARFAKTQCSVPEQFTPLGSWLKASPFRNPPKAMKAFLLLALATVASALTPAQIDVLAALGRGKLQELNRRLPPS